MTGLLPFYVGSLIVGGGLLGSSLLLGGSDHDADADADLDVDGDMDGDADLSGDHDHDHDHAHDAHGPDLGGLLWMPVLSLRFWTFFAAFFGLTGTLLDGLGIAPPGVALGTALAVGLTCGYTTALLIRLLRSKEVDSSIDPERDYVGRSGDVLQDVLPGDPGLVRLHVKGVFVDVEAVVDPDAASLRRGQKVIVIGLSGDKKLRVAHFDTGEDAPSSVPAPQRRPEPA